MKKKTAEKNKGGRPRANQGSLVMARSISASPEQWERWDVAAADWPNRSQWAAPVLDAWAQVASKRIYAEALQSGKSLVEFLRDRLAGES